MITKEQALTISEVHSDTGKYRDGTCHVWRRNGKTQTWKTRPDEYRLPVKYGLYAYGAVTEVTTGFHAPEDCPLKKEES